MHLLGLLGLLNFTSFVSTAGYGAVFLLCVAQSCCVPASSELTLGFAGALAAQGKLNLAGVIAAGVAGEVLGAYVAWVVGRYAGRAAVERYGRFVLLSHHDLDRAEAFYDRHPRFGVLGSRLVPVIRNFVALPAGIAEVPLVRFGILTAAGSLLWDGAWAGIGDGVGAHWHALASGFGNAGYVLGVLALAAIVLAAVHRYRSYRRSASTAGEESARDERARRQRTRGQPAGEVGAGQGAAGEVGAAQGAAGEVGAAPTGTLRWLASSSGARPPAHARRSDFPRSAVAPSDAAVLEVRRGAEPQAAGVGEATGGGGGLVPLAGRIFPAPLAAKVPEVIFAFWVVKILTTAGGEATSDYLRVYGNLEGGAIEVGLFVIGLVLQFGTRRYRALAYWFLAFAIAIFGTGASDFLHLDVGIPYAGTTLLWALVLAVVLWLWHRSEGTLSIHSITTQRREAFYWATVFATFALGTALGDFTATSLHLGYLASGILFGALIFLPAIAWRWFGLNGVAAFWMSYVVTRPLGASFADYVSKPHDISGTNFGDGPTAIVFAAAVLVLVVYLAIARPDIQAAPAVPAPLP